MNSHKFITALKKELYPILRKAGFCGSGNTLLRINQPVVHVFNIQAASSGTNIYLNLGVHLQFLSKTEAKNLKEYECAIRERYDSPGGSGTGWYIGENDEEMNENIIFICEHWSVYAETFYGKLSEYPADFRSLIHAANVSETHPSVLLTYSKIARHFGDNNLSIALAEEALRRCPQRAKDLRANLEELINAEPE